MSWVKTAAALPVAFAQVREDPRLDLEVVAASGPQPRIAMIASGGETALCLGRLPLRRLLLVDANPAQLALVRCKWWLAENASPPEAREWLGHFPLAPEERRGRLEQVFNALELDCNCLGPINSIATQGADRCGRYEQLFEALRRALREHTLEEAFAQTMPLENLVALFGSAATQNPRRSFADHFAERTRLALTRPDAATNPFLQQVLTGEWTYEWDWLQDWRPPVARPEYQIGPMSEVLSAQPAGELDLVHLSNILDWLSANQATTLLHHTARALRPGGLVLIRQLNSSLDIPALASPFTWDQNAGLQMVERDRSYFYPHIHLGRKS